jgi:ABC-type uncharacterized transport system ATPase subunit
MPPFDMEGLFLERIPAIEMKEICKRFPGVLANDNISFRVYPGEIHALLGENGAGKSTLMSILAGLYRPDSGTIKLNGRVVSLNSPGKALEAGIGMIYQHFRLVNNLSVAENIILGMNNGMVRLNQEQIEKDILDFASNFGMNINPATKIYQLSLGEQQRVEILKMLYRGCEILIMDEPTTVLTPAEVKDLFKVLRSMAEQGKGVVLITHKLDEVMNIADYVTVLRNGKVVGEGHIEDLDQKALTKMMVAKEIIPSVLKPEKEKGDLVLSVENINIRGERGNMAVRDLSFGLHKGEILAIAGVAGNGQNELMESLIGLRKLESGSIRFEGQEIKNLDVKSRVGIGIRMIPEDRIGMGLVPNLSIMDNTILRNYYSREFKKGLFLNYNLIKGYARQMVKQYRIACTDIEHPVNYLSGGNLQKLLLGREIDGSPRVLAASYPIRGLDVAAAEDVYKILLAERDKGTAILLVLEDLEDIFKIADRVAVMYKGSIKKILNVKETCIDEIGSIMLGADKVGA